MDGPATIEYWLEESLTTDMDLDLEAEIVRLLEPHKALIELRLEAYDSEKHGSWRDYRNALWYIVHPDDEKTIEGLCKQAEERRRVQFLIRAGKEVTEKLAKDAATHLNKLCGEVIGQSQAGKAVAQLRTAMTQRYNLGWDDLPKQLPALIKLAARKEGEYLKEQYSTLFDVMPHGKMVHIDHIFDAFDDRKGTLEDREGRMLAVLHSAMEDQLVFADGDLYGRMYFACLQADENVAELTCGCVLRRLSDGAVVLLHCDQHNV
jgi:hypothetical protein